MCYGIEKRGNINIDHHDIKESKLFVLIFCKKQIQNGDCCNQRPTNMKNGWNWEKNPQNVYMIKLSCSEGAYEIELKVNLFMQVPKKKLKRTFKLKLICSIATGHINRKTYMIELNTM